MNYEFLDALIPITALATVGGLFCSLRLLRHGKKKAGYGIILASIGLFLLLFAVLSIFE